MNYYALPGLKYRVNQTRPEKIISQVCEHYALKPKDIKGKKRTSELVFPRHLIMYLLHKKAGMNMVQVARMLNRDRSTVMYGVKMIDNYYFTDCNGKKAEILQFY